MQDATVTLKPGREKAVRHHHPWVFSGAVQKIQGEPRPGQTAEVRAADGSWLARGAFSPHSQIAVRLWTWDQEEAVDEAFFVRRIREAAERRVPLLPYSDAVRLVNAENDGLPGLILDRYGNHVVLQCLSTGPELWKEAIVRAVQALGGVAGIFERSDVDVREKEGLPPSVGVLAGEAPPERIKIREGEWQFAVDVRAGHKTGFYLDQRENRRVVHDMVAARAASGTVLNAFSYSGPFAVAALSAGASRVINIDSSGPALGLAQENYALNGLRWEPGDALEEDVFGALRRFRDGGVSFDGIILDPPKFAHGAGDLARAGRAYKDINWLAFRLVRPGGWVVSFSCSGLVSADLFQKILFGAAHDAGRPVQVIGRLGQAQDHPVRLSFPEGTYLTGLVCLVEA